MNYAIFERNMIFMTDDYGVYKIRIYYFASYNDEKLGFTTITPKIAFKNAGPRATLWNQTFRSKSNFVDENRILYHNIYSRPVNHSCRSFSCPGYLAASPQFGDLISDKRNTQFVLRSGVIWREYIIQWGFASKVLCKWEKSYSNRNVDCFLGRWSSPETTVHTVLHDCW